MTMKSINPATGTLLQEIPTHTDTQVETALQNAAACFPDFSPRSRLNERLDWLRKAAKILERDKVRWARTMTAEMGKPITQSEAEIEKCALACRYYADNSVTILVVLHIKTDKPESYVRWLPIGPVLAVMPWNFPFWQVIRFAAPALAAGNVCLLKHASNVAQCAVALEDIFTEAGFPSGAFQTLLIPSSKIDAIIADDRIRAVTLTGSEAAGASVAAQAGRHLKKTVLELGGSDPFIVMPSADLDKAAQTAVTARINNSGQSCIAAKRFIVHADIYDAFLAKFVAAMKDQKIGDPMERDTKIGPLSGEQALKDLAEQVDASVKAGAKIALGGHAIESEGYFYPQTILTDIPRDSPAWRDEFFGPVASVFRVADIDEAIRIANATRFGLGSAAWTNDPDEQARFIDGIDAGFTAINGMTSSDPRLPFGGVKASGYGRELAGMGMHEFLNAKTVVRSA